MNVWVLLVGVVLLVALLYTRERFGETDKIKNPSKWTTNDIVAIQNLVTPPSSLTEQDIRDVVGGFWSYTVGGQTKGWEAATYRITMNDLTQYLDSVIQGNRAAYETNRQQFLELLKAYYIDQGEFQQESETPSLPEEEGPNAQVVRMRPNTTDETLRREVAGYMGIPRNSPDIDKYIGKIQVFYDTVYLPEKRQPTLETIRGFVADQSDIDRTKKPGLESSIDYWFTESRTYADATGETEQQFWSSKAPSAPTPPVPQAPAKAPTTLYGPSSTMPGTNVFGPEFAGYGTSESNSTGGSATTNYPALLGGYLLPSTDSLGVNARNNYFPWARPQAEGSGEPPKWLQGNVANPVSAANYSGNTKTDPVGYLNDFSSFFK